MSDISLNKLVDVFEKDFEEKEFGEEEEEEVVKVYQLSYEYEGEDGLQLDFKHQSERKEFRQTVEKLQREQKERKMNWEKMYQAKGIHGRPQLN